MICQDCGREAATKYVSFHQNIGALIMRFPSQVAGHLCKSCIHKHFWSMTGTTSLLGWWGTISLIVTPFFLLNNIGRYVLCLGMPAVPPGAGRPVLTEEAVAKIEPHASEFFRRLNQGEKLEEVVTSISQLSGASPGQVLLFLHAVANSQPA